MKKHLLKLMFATLTIASLTSFVSCSDDDSDELTISDTKHFNPPAWVQGKWAQESFPEMVQHQYTADDYLQVVMNMTQSYNFLINASQINPIAGERMTLVEEIKTDTRYKYQIISQGSTISHDLEKIGPNKMRDNAEMDGFNVYVKVN